MISRLTRENARGATSIFRRPSRFSPKPPKLTARDLLDPGGEDKTIFVEGYIEVRVAEAMKLKPFKVVADLLELKIFKHTEELIDFDTAAKIAQRDGFRVKGFL
jgi:hypothetical protein